MKNFKTNIFILLSSIILIEVSCNNEGAKSVNTEAATLASIEVSVNGMTCTGCEQTIQNNVAKLDGIKSVKAVYKDNKTIIEFDSEIVDTTKIKTAITKAGYTVAEFTNFHLIESIK